MYKNFTKDEIVVVIVGMSIFLLYRFIDDFTKIHIDGKVIIVLFMLFSGYLFFNRQIKMLYNLHNNLSSYYSVTGVIKDIKSEQVYLGRGKGKYPVFVVIYYDADNVKSEKELHNFFSIKKKKKGDKVGLKINRDDSDDIIVTTSDTFLFIFYSFCGFIVETLLIMLLL